MAGQGAERRRPQAALEFAPSACFHPRVAYLLVEFFGPDGSYNVHFFKGEFELALVHSRLIKRYMG